VLAALVAPNFTSNVELPVDGDVTAVELTATVVDWLAEPPDPVHVSVKVVFAERTPVLSEPVIALVPDQPPDALQDVALVELQVSVEAVPEVIEVGLADNATVGVGALGGATEPAACL
jgi:hypothetical protein